MWQVSPPVHSWAWILLFEIHSLGTQKQNATYHHTFHTTNFKFLQCLIICQSTWGEHLPVLAKSTPALSIISYAHESSWHFICWGKKKRDCVDSILSLHILVNCRKYLKFWKYKIGLTEMEKPSLWQSLGLNDTLHPWQIQKQPNLQDRLYYSEKLG